MDIISNYLNNNNDEFITTLIHIFFLLFTCSLQPILSIFGFTVYFSIFLLLFVPLYKLYWSYARFFQNIPNSSHTTQAQISCFAVPFIPDKINNTSFCVGINPGTFCQFIDHMN